MEDRITELRKNTEKAQNYFSKKLAFHYWPNRVKISYGRRQGKNY